MIREVQHEHILTVSVKDSIEPTKSNYARVTIKVRDYNDHLPQFVDVNYVGVVTETTQVDSTILQVAATDKAHGPNGHVTYSIVSGKPHTDKFKFKILLFSNRHFVVQETLAEHLVYIRNPEF